jgi:hypothetical protein
VESCAWSVDQAGEALDVVQGAVNDIQHHIEKTEELRPTHILARSTDVSALTLTYVTSIIICCFSAVVTTIKCPSIIVSQDHLI